MFVPNFNIIGKVVDKKFPMHYIGVRDGKGRQMCIYEVP